MEETRPINDERICHLNNEEKFFSFIEKRYREHGYELLETCGPNQHAQKFHELKFPSKQNPANFPSF